MKNDRRILYRDKNTGMFVGRGYTGDIEIYKNGKWEKYGHHLGEHAKFVKPKDEQSNKVDKVVEEIDTSGLRNGLRHTPGSGDYRFTREVMEAYLKGEMHAQYLNKQKEKEESKSTDDEFKFSKIAERRLHLNEEQQREVWETLRQANMVGKEIEDQTGGEIKVRFSYNLDHWRVNETTLLARLNAAQRVIEGRYLEDRAEENISNLLETIDLYMDESDVEYADLRNYVGKKGLKETAKEIISSVNSVDLYVLLHEMNLEHLPYAWDSLVRDFGYEYVMDQVADVLRHALSLRD